ncbi:MAG: Rrf2 family transcriptional regulator [Polyangiaceae bacterium]
MNSRLTVAAHILGVLAYREGTGAGAITSEALAESVGTNAVVIRRVLAQLASAGLVASRRGAGGGTVLARDPQRITLRHVYEAVEEGDREILGRHASDVGKACDVAPLIAAYLDELYQDAEEALLRKLESVTVGAMAAEIVDRMRRPQPRVHRPRSTSKR